MLLLDRRRYMHTANDVIMTTATNPEVLAICYAQGWCASADKMTKAEAVAVADIGNAFQASNIVHFEEFQYFTSVSVLKGLAFFNCTSLARIILPTSITNIRYNVFQADSALTYVELPSTLTTLGDYNTFTGCSALPSIDIPSGVTSIPNYCFNNCMNLVLTTLPSGVTTIGNNAFAGANAITDLTIPSGVTTIGAQAFRYARYISTLTCLATTAPSIDSNTFDYMGMSASTRTLRVPSGASGYDQGYWLDLQTRANYPFTIEYI